MKIAIVRQRYNAFGGAERFVERALQSLSHQPGLKVELIAREWAGSPDDRFVFRRCAPFYFTRTGRDHSFAHAVCRIVNSGEYDLVQSHERIACCDIFRAGDGLHHAWLEHRSRVLSGFERFMQSRSPYHRYLLRTEDRLFTNPSLLAVICISRMVQREIIARYRLPESKLPIIYNGIDLATYHPRLASSRLDLRAQWQLPATAPVFLFVGSGFERKGLDVALRALPPQAHLLVVGRDKHQQRYERLAGQMGMTNRVHFCGGQQDVRPFYGAADALVFPTLYEPFGNVVLEALATGLPVVTTFSCGGGELIKHGKNGFVCDALDLDAFRTALAVLTHRDAATSMRAAARASVEHLSLEAMTEALTSLYARLLAEKGP